MQFLLVGVQSWLSANSDRKCVRTVGQEIVICLLSIVALLPTLDIWGTHGLLQALRLDSVLHAGEKRIVPTCETRNTLSLRCRLLCGVGGWSMDHPECHLKVCKAPKPLRKKAPPLFDGLANLG